MWNSPSRATCGIWDVWRHISQWRPIGLKSGRVHSPQNVCLPIGYLTRYQCRTHPLTTEVSAKIFKYAAAISPMLNGFCSPCGSDFQSVSVCIAMNKPCVPKTSDYLIFGLFAQWLLVWTEKDWKFSFWTWPLLLLSAIVLQIWGRRSTTLFYGIGLFWTLFNPQCCHCRLHSTGK